jgi:hypothetical protein
MVNLINSENGEIAKNAALFWPEYLSSMDEENNNI